MLPQSILDHIINNSSISKPRALSNSFQKFNSKSQCSQSFNKEDNIASQNNKESQIDDQISELLFKENVSLQNHEDALMVVSILRKQIKSKLEINFVKKALENLDIWKNQVNLFNQGSSFNNSIFSHMKVQYCQKGEVIFNYGNLCIYKHILILLLTKGDQGTIYYIVAQGIIKFDFFFNILMKSIFYLFAGSFSCLIPKSIKQQKQTDEQLNQEQRLNLQKNISVIQEKTKEIVINPLEELIPITEYVKPSEKQKVVEEVPIQNESQTFSKKKIIQEFKQEDIDEDKIYKLNFPSFTKIKVYTPGESFGEIALLTMQKERKATILSREDGVLITLDKSKFDKILNIFKELKIRNSLDFLHRFSFLNELGPTKLLSLLHCTEIIKFKKSNVIYKEGDKAENIFFIRQGVIMLTKLGEIVDDKLQEQRQQELEENQSLDLNKVKKNQALSQSQIRVQLVVYKENCFFGEDEIMQDLSMRNTKAEVSSFEAEIYIISKQRLFDYLKGSNVYHILVQEYDVKQKWRAQQYKNIINMKQNTINQYNTKMKQMLGEEYRQAYINRINSQLLQSELNKSKACTTSQKLQKPMINNFTKELNLQKKQSSILNKSQISQQEDILADDNFVQKAEQLDTSNSSFVTKQNKQEYYNDNKKDFIQIDEFFKNQDSENISSPLHQTFRIPPELSDNSLNQILEERFQHKQMVLNQSEKKGKPSNFFIVIDPHQRKQQDLDIFKLKKEKTKPVFQKQFQKKRLQNSEQNSKTYQTDKKIFVEQIEDFSQIFNMTRQESQNVQQNIVDQTKNNLFEISHDEKQNFTSISLDSKQTSNKYKNSINSSNDEIKPHQQHKGQNYYPKQIQQDIHSQGSNKQQQNHTQLQQHQQLVDQVQSQNQTQIQVQGQLTPQQNINSFKQSHRKIFSDQAFFNKFNNQCNQQQNFKNFKQNFINPKILPQNIQLAFTQNQQNQESYVNLFSSRTYKQHSQSNFNSLINDQLLFSQRLQKSQLSLQIEQQNNHKQLLMFNNLDVKSVNIYKKPFNPKRNCKSQQSSNVRSSLNEQSPKIQNISYASPRYSMFSNSVAASPKQAQIFEQLPISSSQTKLDVDFVQESQSSKDIKQKLKKLEKEVKYINLKKILKNIESSKIFKQINRNYFTNSNKQIQSTKQKINDFDQIQSTTTNLQAPLYQSSKNYEFKSRVEFSSKLPKRYSTSPNQDYCNYLQPGDFLITSQMQVHKSKKGQQNS
ncbi:hypothetical protein ABPG74_002215 [Tetrahymena malaccensis]